MNEKGNVPPALSVIAAVHNGEAFIEASVRSVLAQTFTDFEFIIVNDGSTDSSLKILDRLASTDPRIRILHRQNEGLTASLCIALQEAKGMYIARQDDDDISLPKRFELQQRFLETHRAVAVVGCRYQSIDKDGGIIGKSNVPISSSAIKRALLTHNVIAHSGAMFHRRKILEIGGYNRSFRTAQDYDLWCRAALHHELANLKEILLLRRRHDNQIGAVLSASQRSNRDRIRGQYRNAILRNEATCPLPFSVRIFAKLISVLNIARERNEDGC